MIRIKSRTPRRGVMSGGPKHYNRLPLATARGTLAGGKLLSALVFLVLAEGLERGFGIADGDLVHRSLAAAANGAHLAAQRAFRRGVGFFRRNEIRRVTHRDAHPSSGGDRVLIGSEKQELPLVFLRLVADTGGELFPSVAGTRSVEDDENFSEVCLHDPVI